MPGFYSQGRGDPLPEPRAAIKDKSLQFQLGSFLLSLFYIYRIYDNICTTIVYLKVFLINDLYLF